MQKLYKPFRIGLLFIIMAALLCVYVPELYKLQIYETRLPEDEQYPRSTMLRTVTSMAARGNIYDRNGVLLASGRPVYNLLINRDVFLETTTTHNQRNEIIKELVFSAMDEGIQYNDTFPITLGAPFAYISDMTSEQRARLESYIEFFRLEPDISAPDLLAWMRGHYRIGFTVSTMEARLIIGVRYEIEVRAIVQNVAPYVFASDVSIDYIPIIEERGLNGLYIENNYVREYHTSNAAHLLGYIGYIPATQFERYTELGYPMDALVGIEGAELAFEEILRSVSGQHTIRTSDIGEVMEINVISEPIPGQHIYLTLDIGLQVAAEDALRSHIEARNLEIDESNIENDENIEKITGGAVAVIDVRTGELLAAATYPTFNRATLSQDWGVLNSDPNQPMLNRATQGIYQPGSTFKMITGLAALRDGAVTRHSQIFDVGIYTEYPDYQPTCWIFPDSRVGHGLLDIVEAITCSCNYYFISASDVTAGGGESGAEAIAEVAKEFGLGVSTGLEIPERIGTHATPENKFRVYYENPEERGWWRGNTLQAAFGQGLNYYTPVQLANYAATIANGGRLHSLTLLRRLVSADMSEVVYSHEPVILNEFEEKEYIDIIKEGMELVTRSRQGTAYRVFGDYPVHVAAKTGTVQVETDETNTGVFVCYAPAENPEIAISIVIEKGGSGAAVMEIAKVLFDYYFGQRITAFTVPYGELIP